MTRPCPHGDPSCVCQDGDSCHYVDLVLPGGRVSPAAPCPRTGRTDGQCCRPEFGKKTHGKRGTYTAGCRCAECKDANRRYKAGERAGRPACNSAEGRPFPIGELLEVAHLSVAELCRLTGKDSAQVSRWRRSGLTVALADQLACAVGLHPASVWAEWFDGAVLEATA